MNAWRGLSVLRQCRRTSWETLTVPAEKPRCQTRCGWVWLGPVSFSGMSSRDRGTLPSCSLVFARFTFRCPIFIASRKTRCAAICTMFTTRCAATDHNQARAIVDTGSPGDRLSGSALLSCSVRRQQCEGGRIFHITNIASRAIATSKTVAFVDGQQKYGTAAACSILPKALVG